MSFRSAPFWSKTPFIRILIPFIIGIIFQWKFHFVQKNLFIFFTALLLFFLLFKFLKNFSLLWIRGFIIQLIFLSIGLISFSLQDIRNNKNWIGHYYKDSSVVLVTLQEPTVEKTKSFKALASFDSIYINNKWINVTGNLLLYFKKDSIKPQLQYGSQILISKNLIAIKKSGNPGGFNYEQYAAHQDIYHQVFLNNNDYKSTNILKENWFNKLLISSKNYLLKSLKQNIKNPKAVAVAEALLIGYRDDLDKDLVQAYSNTGVVHIIAISGLHLGMIYGLLLAFFIPLKKKKITRWLKPVIILFVLWMFSFLAGAGPSIVRSAVMFSFIILAESIQRKSYVYNTLAASAFVMLLYNPFFLWDVGFQLSYAAVISIITFMKPISKWFYFQNKFIKKIWQLNAVTLSAQVLTLPVMLYHFHQFPNLFLLTNFIAVPLSGFILYSELILIVIAPIKSLALLVGYITNGMIEFMNHYIERLNGLSIAVTDYIQISLLQSLCLMIFLLLFYFWLIQKKKSLFIYSLISFLFFIGLRTFDIIKKNSQQKIIVYNVPQHKAIDIINANSFYFLGDSVLLEDDFLQNFHLKPARILYRIKPENISVIQTNAFQFNNKNILIIDEKLNPFVKIPNKINVDLIILQKNLNISFKQLNNTFNCNYYVADATNSLWKINKWKKDCENLHLRLHSVQEQGALIMDF